MRFVECRFVLPKPMRFFIKLSSIKRVSISLKLSESFVKLTFTKSALCKMSFMDCGLISPKFKRFFYKIYIPICS